ncbi:binding-protein-dependent transport systems inner membrane component [Halalkalibacter wakoensis JCM 9140]|uniref:Binding-protein-dependent transport systems inner membrane component n=1 Tax=Halalkalibacter wakoensis JCM 9140 TaxID=1236970 RepID=W4Q8R4_9BACI|nr:sugar ABC transporter permease [Halalkalibacter wakoensis]GAE28073.1 binding-protein-dependent transport systems inner membrane component [Halalkalibacter wakoensis JCM 9140]
MKTSVVKNTKDTITSAHVKPNSLWKEMKKYKIAYVFMLPAILLISFFMLIPLCHSIIMSFYRWDGITTPTFNGLSNYTHLLTNNHFWKAAFNNLKFLVLFTALTVILGFVFAVAIDRRMKGWRIYKFVFFIPFMLVTAALGILFAQIYEPSHGILNTFLGSIGLESLQQLWLGDSNITLYSIIAVAIWQLSGWTMILYLAAIEGIDNQVHDAATIDGVTEWQRMFHIIAPMVKRITYMIILLQIIASLKTFDLIWVMTKGGPFYASEVLGTILYRTAFEQQQFGYASAVAVLMTIIVMSITLIYLKYSKLSEQE